MKERIRIHDLAVREPDIEATIRRIYEERLLHPEVDDVKSPNRPSQVAGI